MSENQHDFLNMSDDDFNNFKFEFGDDQQEEDTPESEPREEEVDDVPEPEEEEVPEQEDNNPEGEEQTTEEEEDTPDYKAVYDRLFTQPIRANGKDMQLQNVDDVISLVQMGANYNKKMASIKQTIPFIKMLENANLLDKDRLSFLIDLSERKPEAIAKLIQDSALDMYDFNVEEKAKEYQPVNRYPDAQQLELQETLASLKDEDESLYNKTVSAVGAWDDKSGNFLAANPEKIRVLQEHMGNGIFETVWTEVERLRMLGKLQGVSDFDAYKQVGDFLYNQPQPKPRQQQPVSQPKNEQKKKIAAGTNQRPADNTSPTNFLNMSDEEFMRLGDPNLM